MRSARLTAAITGRAREIGPVEAHERTVLAVTNKIHTKQRRLREALTAVKRLRRELRHDKREFRALLQRNPDVTTEQLELAGHADGVDRAIALAEARPTMTHNHVAADPCNAMSCPVARHLSHPTAAPIREAWQS